MLALVLALGATPLAVYADEAQTGISTVSEDPEEKDKDNTNKNPEEKDKDNTDESSEGKDKDKTNEDTEEKDKDKTNEDTEEKDKDKTNEDTEEKDNSNTNEGSEADAPESEEKAAATVGIAPQAASTYVAWIGDKGYTTLKDAVNDAPKNELTEIRLGEGTYTLYNTKGVEVRYKNLTFVGAGRDKTTWLVGPKVPDPEKFGTEYNSDYSFDVRGSNAEPRTPDESETVTFKGMTLQTGKVDYLGFSGSDNTVVEDCTIEGRTAYWGYRSAKFINTTFTAPPSDYAIWTYSSADMTFQNCIFNVTGKAVNVYTDFGATQHDFTINFDSCTVNSTKANKTALSINDSLMTNEGKGFKFYVNITGNNTINGLKPDTKTCSRLFGFSNDKITKYNGKEYHYDSGATVVTINGKPVWKDAARFVEHNGNAFEGTYNNGTGKGDANQYTEGYKDNAFDTNVTGWTLKANTTNTYVRTITKQCQYCHEKIVEQEEKAGYCLRYDLNGGTGAEGTYNDTYYPPQDGNTATVAADPSRAGYQFAGWQDAAGNQYAAGNTVTVDRDITLTAQWNKLVTVSFDLCGHGGANIPSQTFVSGNKASEPTAPKEDGWVFGGWYTEKGCQYRFSFDSAVTSDITLYAKWDRVTTVASAPVATPTPSPAPAAAATKTATVKNAAIPQTSDAFPVEGLLALLAVGAVGFGAAGWLRKKHH